MFTYIKVKSLALISVLFFVPVVRPLVLPDPEQFALFWNGESQKGLERAYIEQKDLKY